MKKLILLFSTLFIFNLHSQESANFGAAKFAPEDGKKMLIIGQDLGAVGGLVNYTNGYLDNIDCPYPPGVTSYTNIASLDGLTALANWGSGDVRAQAYVNDPAFNNTSIAIGLYMVGSLTNITNGNLDNNIQNLGNWIRGQDRPIFLRIGYEFEGPWNNYDPTQFKNAWRYIVAKFDELEVRNVAYVWQSAGLNYNNIINWYPGDEYVNWVGYSHFDGPNPGLSIRNFANQRNKPIMIAEATPRVDLGDGNGQMHWDNWFQPLFNSIYANNKIKALAYINVDWDSQPMWNGQGWGDSRVQASPLVKAEWEEEIKTSPWLTDNANFFEDINYQSWISTELENPAILAPEKLIISHAQNKLSIKEAGLQELDGLEIRDFNGQLIYENNQKEILYEVDISFPNIKGIIIIVNLGKKRIIQRYSYTP